MVKWYITILFFWSFFPLFTSGQNQLSMGMTKYGISLHWNGEPLSIGSRIITFAENELLFNLKNEKYDIAHSGQKYECIFPAQTGKEVQIKQYCILKKGNSAVISLEFLYQGQKSCSFEYAPLILPASLVSGAKYHATSATGQVESGIILVSPQKTDMFKEFGKLRRLEILTDSVRFVTDTLNGSAFTVSDRRFNVYNGQACLVLLITQELTAKTGNVTSNLKISCFPSAAPKHSPIQTAIPAVYSAQRNITASPFPQLPAAKDIRTKNGLWYQLQPEDKAIIAGEVSNRLSYHLNRLFGLKAESGTMTPEHGFFIEIGKDKGIAECPEGYILDVSEKLVRISSQTEQGAFYALQTLRSFLRNNAIAGVAIRDWPDFRLRGWHTIANSGTLKFWGTMLEKVGAPLKINTFLLECQYVQWDKAGTPKNPRGMSKKDLLQLLRLAHLNYIEVIPLLQSLSHCEWMFYGNSNLEMAENIKKPYAYNVSNPQVYELLKKVYDEIFELFPDTPYFHGGHDELQVGVHKFPVRPENIKRGIADIFEKDVLWHHQYLKKHGKKLMIWHDMLIHENEAEGCVSLAAGGTEKLRAKLPRDIMICIWNYKSPYQERKPNNPESFPEIDIFQKDGYKVIGCTWYPAGNIENFSDYCLGKNIYGMINTTWSHFGTETVLHSHFEQITAHVTAAACFWNARKKTARLDCAKILKQLLFPDKNVQEKLETIPFSANLILDDPRYSFDKIKSDILNIDSVPFALAKSNGFPAALTGKSNPYPLFPDRITIPVNHCFKKLYFLHTILRNSYRKIPICLVSVKYKDQSIETFLIRSQMRTLGAAVAPTFVDEHGRTALNAYEVFAPNTSDFGFLNSKDNVYQWTGHDNNPLRIWSLEWHNPHPEREIKEIILSRFDSKEPYFLLGITGGN